MPLYADSNQLYETMKALFTRIRDQGGAQSVGKSRLVLRFHTRQPEAVITIDGRQQPVQVSYGPSKLRADLEVELPADALHQILLGELRLSKALGSGQMKVRGPIFKTFALEEVFHLGQALYPQILREMGRAD